jgi:hypothetical protein
MLFLTVVSLSKLSRSNVYIGIAEPAFALAQSAKGFCPCVAVGVIDTQIDTRQRDIEQAQRPARVDDCVSLFGPDLLDSGFLLYHAADTTRS